MTSHDQLLATLAACETARGVALREKKWADYIEACEASAKVARHLELEAIQELQEAKIGL